MNKAVSLPIIFALTTAAKAAEPTGLCTAIAEHSQARVDQVWTITPHF